MLRRVEINQSKGETMRKSLSILLLAFAIMVSLYFAANSSFNTFAQSKVNSQKWQYCAITEFFGTGSAGKTEGYAKINFFDPEGNREQWIKAEGETISISNQPDPDVYQRAREKALSDAIAHLGSQGWEMVGELRYARTRHVQLSGEFSTTQDGSALYFKRLKP